MCLGRLWRLRQADTVMVKQWEYKENFQRNEGQTLTCVGQGKEGHCGDEQGLQKEAPRVAWSWSWS